MSEITYVFLQVTDQSLIMLSECCKGLESVCAMGCGFTDHGMKYIAKVSGIQYF